MRLSVSAVLSDIVDKKCTDSDLGTDVAELGTKGEEHVVLLPDGALSDLVPFFVYGHDFDIGVFGERGFGDFGELGEDVEDHD